MNVKMYADVVYADFVFNSNMKFYMKSNFIPPILILWRFSMLLNVKLFFRNTLV